MMEEMEAEMTGISLHPFSRFFISAQQRETT
jgi:hypothetical protein